MRARPPLLVLLALLALLVPVQLPASSVAADRHPGNDRHERATPTLTITDHSRGTGVIPRAIVGGNLRWLNRADGAWDPQHHRIRKDIAELARRIGLGTIRYPGGTVANVFDYTHALGEPQCQTSGGFVGKAFASIPAHSSQFSIPRQAAFANDTHASTNLMIPMINATADDAVGYVKAVANATGQKDFYVEIGNEPYNKAQRYWRAKPLGDRLDEYILGGTRSPSGSSGDNGLYPVSGCNLAKPAHGTGRTNQTYRPRYTPISTTVRPRVWVDGEEWTYTRSLTTDCLLGLGGHKEFTVSADQQRIVFGGCPLGAGRPPKGASLKIKYATGPNDGFNDYYRALTSIPGLTVHVCSSWASDAFVARMDQLGDDYDCLAVHSYANIGGPTGTQRTFTTLMRAARNQVSRLSHLRHEMQDSSHPGAKDRFLTVTEFGGQHRERHDADVTFAREMVKALELVGQVNQGVRLSNLSNFSSLFEYFNNRATLSGQAYVLGFVRRLVGQVAVDVTGAPSDLAVAGTRDGRRAGLLVVNAAWSRNYRMRIDLPGRAGSTCVGVRSLRTDTDGFTRPRSASGRPRSVRKPQSLVWGKGKLTHTFPSHSISLLTFSPKAGGKCPAVGAL